MLVYDKLDEIIFAIKTRMDDKRFRKAIEARRNRYCDTVDKEGDNILRVMAKLVAYSNNAPSDGVNKLLGGEVFERAFHGFDIAAVANERQDKIVENYWAALKAIRHKKKIGFIIKCAKILVDEGREKATIRSLYEHCHLPVVLRAENDLHIFWENFDELQVRYKRQGMPYFKNTTTLLHLLLHVGFPCLKPDLIVMKVAAELGLVKGRENHNQYRSSERRAVVRALQEYCLSRALAPAVLDLYLLIYGGQRGVTRNVCETS